MANNSQAKDVYFIEGGTGIQGGSVIEQLLLLKPAPVIRTISRDLSSPAGRNKILIKIYNISLLSLISNVNLCKLTVILVKKLQEQGVEVIQGGQGDKVIYFYIPT